MREKDAILPSTVPWPTWLQPTGLRPRSQASTPVQDNAFRRQCPLRPSSALPVEPCTHTDATAADTARARNDCMAWAPQILEFGKQGVPTPQASRRGTPSKYVRPLASSRLVPANRFSLAIRFL